MNNDFDIPVKIEVEKDKVENQLGKVGSFLLISALDMLFGKRGLIQPEYETLNNNEKYNIEKDYSIVEIKEKFGGLRWYDNGFPEKGWEEYKDWLYKYEDLSFKTCINCGKPAIGFTRGWITPLCKECMKDQKYDPIEDDNKEA